MTIVNLSEIITKAEVPAKINLGYVIHPYVKVTANGSPSGTATTTIVT